MKERKVETVVQAIDEVKVDRISDLIEPLVHQIMSFLPPTEIAVTSALSKKFNSLWRSFPIIAFDQDLFIANSSGMWELQPSEAMNIFLDFVVSSIQLRQLETDLEKFSLKCDIEEITSDPRIDMAISFALNNNVKDLCLIFPEYDFNVEEVWYDLKETFDLKSVRILKLEGCKVNLNWLVSTTPLMQSLTLCDSFVSEDDIIPSGNDTKFTVGQSLRLLSFQNVNISQKWVRKYICKFKKLESLHMSECRRLKHIRISSESLKEIAVNNYNLVSIEMIAPALVSFEIAGEVSKQCTIDIAACEVIKNISLHAVHVTDEWIRAQVVLFSHLEKLRLVECVELVRFHIASNHLRTLELRDCDKLAEVNIDAPNLVSFEYSGILVFLSLMNSPCLRNPTLTIISNVARDNDRSTRPTKYVPPPYGWFSGLRDFLTMFDHCEALTLICNFYQDVIFPKNLRDTELSPLYDIKSLRIEFWFVPKIETELVDSLLWISPHVETLCFASEPVEKIIKLRYERKKIKDTTTFCCNLQPIKCWRHYLKGVEMRNFDKNDDIEGLLEYFQRECQVAGNSIPRNQ